MALSIVQGTVAAALTSGGAGGGLGYQYSKPSDSSASGLDQAFLNRFHRFVEEGGPPDMDKFLSSLLAETSLRDRRGISPEAEKRARKAREDLVAQGKKMTISAGEPLLFQVNFLCGFSNVLLTFNFSERRQRRWR